MKVQESIEAPGCGEINIKVIKDMQSTNTVDQMHLESKIYHKMYHKPLELS